MAPMAPIKLYSDRAAKFVSVPVKVAPPTMASSAGYRTKPNIFQDYCANSSIHGFKYFVGANRTLVEKIWWLAMCILSIYGCARLIDNVYDRWRRNPVVVTFAEKPTPIYDIPFPAVTICPITKVKTSMLNFTAVYQKMIQKDPSNNVSDKEVDRFMAMIQVCDFSFNGFTDNQTYDDNIVSVLQEMAIPFNEIFLLCVWKNDYVNCSDMFTPTLTENGICYTFNALSADDLLRKGEFHHDFEHLGEKQSAENWSMEEGYKAHLGTKTFPQRTTSPGATSGLIVLLKSELSDMDFLCGNSFQGFKMQLHTSNQCPQISSQYMRITMNQAITVRIDPFQTTTSQNVRSYSPAKRLCYYTHERYLRFFKIYTMRNCELECLANVTLHLCGCVLFSMPRTSGVRMCGIEKLGCCSQAYAILQEQGLNVAESSAREMVSKCNCLPACTFLQYNAEISQANFQWRRLTDAVGLFREELKNAELTSISIYFKEAHFIPIKRNQLFGINDFVANCGGILGLFMGVSLLSIVEMLYYFTMKPLINHFFQRPRNARRIAMVEPFAGAQGLSYNTAFNKFVRDVV